MIYQSTNYTCGPAAIVNACLVLGVRVSENKARLLAGTTPKDGTDVAGMLKALTSIGVGASPFDMKLSGAGLAKIYQPNPTIICVNGWDHWVTVIGTVNCTWEHPKFIIIDSANTEKNRKTNGVHMMTWKQVKKVWGHGTCTTYSGISVDHLDTQKLR